MKFPPQPCSAPSESTRLGAKQGRATIAKAATQNSKPHSHPAPIRSGFHTFILSHLSTIQHPRASVSRKSGEKSKIQNYNAPLLTPSPLNPLIPRRFPAAFSLTEVVIAMGVAAVAFTSIIALFPLGLNMSKESYEATQAALIAQTIMADLKDEQSGGGNLRRSPNPGRYRLLQISPNSDPMGVKTNYAEILFYTTNPQTAYIAYKPSDGATSDTDTSNPLIMRPYTYSYTEDSATAPNWYTSGTNGAFALVKVTISPTLPSDSGNEGSPRRIDMSVETPGSANVSNRTCYLFTGASQQ
jgi:type II secretory pathway pseudopilin PulG